MPAASPMRLFQFQIPASGGSKEHAELTVFYFGEGQGGSVDDNITRWKGQFRPLDPDFSPQIKERQVRGLGITTVHLEGTYQSGMPMTDEPPLENYAVLGAIVKGPKGMVFFKAAGPKEVLRAAQTDFDTLLESLQAEP